MEEKFDKIILLLMIGLMNKYQAQANMMMVMMMRSSRSLMFSA